MCQFTELSSFLPHNGLTTHTIWSVMEDSTLWWLVAGGAVALELVTGTFFLLMLAIGLAAGALAAHAGFALTGQLLAAAFVGGGAVVLWQRWRKRQKVLRVAEENPDVNLDIGETVAVQHWEPDGSARVRYRGADWTVQPYTPLVTPVPGVYRIVSVQGNRLLVSPL
jgi:membrane protein implicated in regulation of membrane protease activity